jgi:LPS-assembly lipoprotein
MADRRAALLGLLVALGGCGFRPLLAESEGDDAVRDQLAAIEIRGLQGSRLGQLVRNGLTDQLDPTSARPPSRYSLIVELRRRTRSLGIQLDNTITRYNLTLTARFKLLDQSNRRLLYGSRVTRVASYNVSREPYADLIAEEDAERRAAREVTIDLRNLLATYLARADEVV